MMREELEVSGQQWWGEERVYSLVWDVEKGDYEKFVVEEGILQQEKNCKRLLEMHWWIEERVCSLVWDAEREGHGKCIDEESLLEKEYKGLLEMLLLCLIIIEERVLL